MRLFHGPIPLDEALPIAKQIAEALEAAHAQGIIHRDLKPANIKLRADGRVKVLDFGLAKVMEPGGGSPDISSPTITRQAMTQAGAILGTAAYMSPEQARGKPVDKRVDIWAFGCVLFEMLTGKAAFVKDNASDTLAAVLGAEPDWKTLAPTVPASLRLLVRRCLEKDRQRRIADISTAIFLMNEPLMTATATGPATAIAPARGGRAWSRLAVVATIVVAAVGGAATVWLQTRPAPGRVARFAIPLWGPDGREIFYRDPGGAVMRAAIERGPGWAAGTPTKLFDAGQYHFGTEAFGRSYDISRDGRRLLMIKNVALNQASAPTVLVVQNWFEELKRLVPTQ